MKSLEKIISLRTLSWSQIIGGAILLAQEVQDFIVLPTTMEIDRMYPTVDLIKYKDNTYLLIPLWILLIIAGVGYYVDKKAYKVLSILWLILLIFHETSIPFSLLLRITNTYE